MVAAPALAATCALTCVIALCLYCEVGAQLIGREESPRFPVGFTTRDRDFQPDVFWVAVVVITVAFVGTLTKVEVSKAGAAVDAVLPRQQTDEWKGWMQVVILLYHYFGMSELYKPARLIVATYVWLTAYGNTLYFLQAGNVAASRVFAVVLRTCLFPCLVSSALSQPMMLYYVVPQSVLTVLLCCALVKLQAWVSRLHSGSPRQSDRWFALAIIALLCFLWWDLHVQDAVLQWLFNMRSGHLLPAGIGQPSTLRPVHEWMFRTSLDHFAVLWGAAFAIYMTGHNKQEPATPRSLWKVVTVIIAGATAVMVWYTHAFTLSKLAFNELHPYLSVVPIMAFVALRNCCAWLRSRYSAAAATMGRLTLETYILQHHVWLTSNAKQVIVLIPGLPAVNFVVTTLAFLSLCYLARAASDELCKAITQKVVPLSRREVTEGVAILSVALMSFLCTACQYWPSFVLDYIPYDTIDSPIQWFLGGIALLSVPWVLSQPCMGRVWLLLVLCGSALFGLTGSAVTSTVVADVLSPLPMSKDCLPILGSRTSVSGWAQQPDGADGVLPAVTWQHSRYVLHHCGFCLQRSSQSLLGHSVLFIGDSQARNLFRIAVCRQSQQRQVGSCALNNNTVDCPSLCEHPFFGHNDFDVHFTTTNGPTHRYAFVWAPYFHNITELHRATPTASAGMEVVVLSVGSWDLLHQSNLTSDAFSALKHFTFADGNKFPAIVWATQPPFVPSRLPSPEKRQRLSNSVIAQYNAQVAANLPLDAVVLDLFQMFQHRKHASYDGVHYTDVEYVAATDKLQQLLGCYHEFPMHGRGNRRKVDMIPGDAKLGLVGLGLLAAVVFALFVFA